MGIGVINCIFLILIFSVALTQTAFAETESLVIAARSYEQIAIYLNQGDELKFAMTVSGGSNDDISLTIFFPDGTDVSGGVYEEHSDSFVATSTGTYVFSFDNTFSLISNKFVQFSYQKIQNTYFVYVDDPPPIADNVDNVMYKATKAWMDANPQMNFYVASSPEKADFRVQWVKEFGTEYVGYAFGNKFIEVGLGDSNCNGVWQPYSQDHVEFIMKHEIGHILGQDHVDDPNSLMYPIALNKEYDWVIKKYTLGSGYGQFIPICSVKDLTSYQFHVSIDDPTHGFDVYFVPSKDSFDKWSKGEKFRYYSDENCFSEGYLSIGGKCHGVKKESGLFVITDSVLSEEIATITVQHKEQLIPIGALLSPIDLKLNTGYHDLASISVRIFDDELDFSSSRYQEKDDYIRFENGDGTIIHRYSPYVSFDDLFESFGMKLTDSCLILQDKRKFCNNNDNSLIFTLNGKQKKSIANYIFEENDVLYIDYEQKPKIIQNTLTQKTDEITASTTPTPSSSQKSTITCGEGTILKDGICVPKESSIQSQSKGGGCLIATATYGSELAPQVQQLREIRANILLQTQSGSSFMETFNKFYYSFSPTIADWERESPMFKETVKLTITPLLASLYIMQFVEEGSENQVLGLGIGIIALNLGMYIVAPALAIITISRRIR